MKALVHLAAIVLMACVTALAHAMPILSLSSHAPRVFPGQNLVLDVSIAGLDTASDSFPVGAFSFRLRHNAGLLFRPGSPTAPGAGLGNPLAGEAVYDVQDNAGTLTFAGISFLDGGTLADLQGERFLLATLAFYVPPDFVATSSALFFFADNIVVSDADGDPITTAPTATLAVPIPLPGTLPLLAIGAAGMWLARRSRRFLAVAALAACGSAGAQVTQPLPDGPLAVTIQSTSLVRETYFVTAGRMDGFTDSLIPMGVNESNKPNSRAQFELVAPARVKITFSSDMGSNFDRYLDFTPGIYFVGMSYDSSGIDDARLTIQKWQGGFFGPPLLDVTKSAWTYVHAFFRTASSGASGIEQTVDVEQTVSVNKTVPVPAGDVTYRNSDGLWPAGLLCSSPLSCASMARTVSVPGRGSVSLSVKNGINSTSGVLAPSRYDQIEVTMSGYDLQLVHTRIPFVPPGDPTIDLLPAQAPITAEDRTRTLLLTGLGDGTEGEVQALRLSVASANPALIAAPQLEYRQGDSTALLRYRAVPGAQGQATLTVTVTDDGATPGYPADDRSRTMSFAVRVLAERACGGVDCRVYFTQRDTNLVEVVDAGSNIVSDNIRGGYPIALSPDGRRLYSVVGDSLLVVDPASHAVLATLALPDHPNAMAQSPSGDRLYLTIPAVLLDAHDMLVVVDPDARTVSSFDLGRHGFADSVVGSVDGRRLYVSTSAGELLTLSAPDLQVLRATPIDGGPHRMAVSAAGDRVYVVSHDHDNVAVVDTARGEVIARIATGRLPEGVALTPDGKLALVAEFTSAFDGHVNFIDTSTLKIVGSTPTNGLNGPTEIAITPDGTRAYVSFETDRSVIVLSTLTRRITKTIAIGTPTIGAVLAALPLQPRMQGDVTHDGVVDRADVDLLRADMNKPVNASACGLACDLDADGVITVLDARRMVTMCRASGCGVP